MAQSNARLLSIWHVLLMALAITTLSGCSGCDPSQWTPTGKRSLDPDDEKKKDKPVEARLDAGVLQALPAPSQSDALYLKAGHWYEFEQATKANFGDESLLQSMVVTDRRFRPMSTFGMDQAMIFRRPTSLARGQTKRVHSELFMPDAPSIAADQDTQSRPAIRVSFAPRTLGAAVLEEAYPVNLMPDYQYYMVILDLAPDRFAFLKTTSAIVWPSQLLMEDERVAPFRLVPIAADDAASHLPTQLGTWTSTSHLIWSDCSPSRLLPSQRQAILDWLHFGGQIIVDGPEGQAALQGSFLEPYLPLQKVQLGQHSDERWAAFNNYWSIADAAQNRRDIAVPAARNVPIIQGELSEGSQWLPSSEGLVAERAVGTGRVVMTTFPLSENMVVGWPSYGSFLHNALLGRPSRTWALSPSSNMYNLVYAGGFLGREREPALTSQFRLLGRTLASGRSQIEGRPDIPDYLNEIPDSYALPQSPAATRITALRESQRRPHDLGRLYRSSAVGDMALEILREASGIRVPRLKTILWLLASYLAVLVPLNWLFFRLLGRLEWAWLAAPVIAMIGAVVVARTVQLDVGFSRSQTAMHLVEFQNGYPRAHVSTFVALYTSLSTPYAAYVREGSGLVLPVTGESNRRNEPLSLESGWNYALESDGRAGLQSFPIRSNATGFLRGESLLEAEGQWTVAWDDLEAKRLSIRNRTGVRLRDAAVLATGADGQSRWGWIGDIEAGADAAAQLEDRVFPTRQTGQANDNKEEVMFLGPLEPWRNLGQAKPDDNQAPGGAGELPVGLWLMGIANQVPLERGQAIVLGWTETQVPSLEIQPVATQQAERSVVAIRSAASLASAWKPDEQLPSKNQIEETEPIDDELDSSPSN